MNIPQVPPEGWTRPFINQLRAIADSIDPGPTIDEHRWMNKKWRTLSGDQKNELMDAIWDSLHEFKRVEQIMLDDHKEPGWSPEIWINYVVADRRHRSYEIAVARRLFDRCALGAQTQGETS